MYLLGGGGLTFVLICVSLMACVVRSFAVCGSSRGRTCGFHCLSKGQHVVVQSEGALPACRCLPAPMLVASRTLCLLSCDVWC